MMNNRDGVSDEKALRLPVINNESSAAVRNMQMHSRYATSVKMRNSVRLL